MNKVQSMVSGQIPQSGFDSEMSSFVIDQKYRLKEYEWTFHEVSSSNESLSALFQFLDGMDGALKRDYDLR